MIIAHLLPLTKYLVNGQYAKVQPIASNFAERCICTILTTNHQPLSHIWAIHTDSPFFMRCRCIALMEINTTDRRVKKGGFMPL